MKSLTVILAIVIIVSGLLIGVAAAKWAHANAPTEISKYSHPVSPGDPTGVFEVAGETVKITFDATAELQSLFLAVQSMMIPQSIELQAGSAQVVFDGPIAEVTVLLMTLVIGLVIIWKVRK